jgi:hypothetical protein
MFTSIQRAVLLAVTVLLSIIAVVVVDADKNDTAVTPTTVPVVVVPVDKFQMVFKPTMEYQQALPRVHDKLYFTPTLPNMTNDGCWYQCVTDICQTICGGTFTINLDGYEVLEFKFDLGEDTLLVPSLKDQRIRIAFYAQAVNCTNGELLLNKFIKAEKIEYIGSDVDPLMSYYDQDVRVNVGPLFARCLSHTHVSSPLFHSILYLLLVEILCANHPLQFVDQTRICCQRRRRRLPRRHRHRRRHRRGQHHHQQQCPRRQCDEYYLVDCP